MMCRTRGVSVIALRADSRQLVPKNLVVGPEGSVPAREGLGARAARCGERFSKRGIAKRLEPFCESFPISARHEQRFILPDTLPKYGQVAHQSGDSSQQRFIQRQTVSFVQG